MGESAAPLPYKIAEQQPSVVVSERSKAYDVTSCETEEMMLIRYLLLFGSLEFYEEKQEGATYSVSVGEYIISELAEDELLMLNPRFREIQSEYRRNFRSEGFIPAKYFIGHRIRRLVQLWLIF